MLAGPHQLLCHAAQPPTTTSSCPPPLALRSPSCCTLPRLAGWAARTRCLLSGVLHAPVAALDAHRTCSRRPSWQHQKASTGGFSRCSTTQLLRVPVRS